MSEVLHLTVNVEHVELYFIHGMCDCKWVVVEHCGLLCQAFDLVEIVPLPPNMRVSAHMPPNLNASRGPIFKLRSHFVEQSLVFI